MAADDGALVEGLDRHRLERLGAYVSRQVDELKKAPFMQLLVARNGRVVYTASAGRGRMEDPASRPVDLDTIVRIYSMTKPIVSAAAMILVERAELHLDHAVERYLPCFKNMRVVDERSPGKTRPVKTKMTVQHLLTHSSGLTYGFMPNAVGKMYVENGVGFGNADHKRDGEPGALLAMVRKLAEMPLLADPGTAFNYSVGIDVVGCLIEHISGKLLPDFLKQEIFDPLGMTDTGFFVPKEKVARFSACYSYTPEGPEDFVRNDDNNEKSPFLVERRHMCSGGGGLVGTLRDYAAFAMMLQGKGQLRGRRRILSRKTVDFMALNHLEPGVFVPPGFLHAYHGVGFGIGGSVTIDPARNALIGSVGQLSWGGAGNTYVNIDLQEDLSFIMFTQVMPSLLLCQWRRDLTNLVESCVVDLPKRSRSRHHRL